ncbi:GGDEF domain-containing protein [Brevibacillus sp. H7]|uniref:GGDEF domain-containing protein n=1 Tax=Brevibacillus sp. H7 TaxID=3349138 RepID=UPI003810D18E
MKESTLAQPARRLMTVENDRNDGHMRFHDTVWQYFQQRQLTERLLHWTKSARGKWFRLPVDWSDANGELHVTLPPLPEGYRPLSEWPRKTGQHPQILLFISSLCDALAVLHQNRFHMGFLIPEQIYYHPETMEVLLDIQPYPSAFPFVKHALTEYPFSFLSRYARQHNMPRTADFCAIGLLLAWLTDEREMSEFLRWLTNRLVEAPESFLFAEEIGSLARAEAGLPSTESPTAPAADASLLHPSSPPLTQCQQNQLRAFLRSEGERLIGIICEDEMTRLDVYMQHFNEVMESDFFFTISCRNLPYGTIRELIERTTLSAFRFFGRDKAFLITLTRKLDRIFQQHYVGDDIVHSLSEWLFQFYSALTPMMEWQHFYYAFEGCEHFDEDSQRVLMRFWEKYSSRITGLFAIFSGKEKPGLIPGFSLRFLSVGKKEPHMYRRVLLSQLGRAESELLDRLANWLTEQQTEFNYCRLLLEKLIETGQIVLKREGWRCADHFEWDQEQLSIRKLLSERLAQLSEKELDLLRTLSCLPMPVRAGDIFHKNELDMGELNHTLSRLLQLGLLPVYHPNCIYVPVEVSRLTIYELPLETQTRYFQRALQLQRNYRPGTLPPQIELAHLAKDKRMEYELLIRYYRQIRLLLTLERRKVILQNLKQLQQALGRHRVCCWDRLLVQVYIRLNQFEQAEKLSYSLYQRTGALQDRFAWIRVLLFTNQTDVTALKQELSGFVSDKHLPLADRARAAHLLAYVDFFTPLHQEGAGIIDDFYRHELYPQREQISIRLFAELTIMYTTILFQYFPELSEWASALRKKLESMLESSCHHDLMIELYNSYCFDNNVHVALTYTKRQLEMAKRYGFTTKQQISHLNGMELSLYHGDLDGYAYHMENVSLVDEIKRADLLEQYYTHQLMFACEWKRDELFRQLEEQIFTKDLGDWSFSLWENYSRYLSFRRGRPMPPPLVWQKETDLSVFIDALYQAEKGEFAEACRLFQRSIELNGFRIVAGWAYREMIQILLKSGSEEAEHWLKEFEKYMKENSYDLFWPDYYRASAAWWLKQGNLQQAMLYMRRAANGYQLIEKEEEYQQVLRDLESVVQPRFLTENPLLLKEPFVQQLLAERAQLLEQSLDLQIIIQLSERVTETLELTRTIQRLVYALFEYFPISHLSIDYNLFYSRKKVHYSVSGILSQEELARFLARQECEQKYVVPLYHQNGQAIVLEVYSGALSETKEQHMEQFLSFIKPHIANALLYMEMMIDNLTGFYQRRYFMNALAKELELAKRYDLDLSLIMLDIDNFRKVNEYGHQEGDRVLRELADMIRGTLRKNDIPGRFGGEEMLLILPKTDGKAALRLAERLRLSIEEEFADNRPYRLTVSVGVSTLNRSHTKTSEELIRLADDAEITAKTTGKNRVVAAWEETSGPPPS